MRINVLQERISILNQVAKYLLSSIENKQKMKLNVAEKELNELSIQIALESDRYKNIVFKVNKFINRLSKKILKEEGIGFQK